ncbi:MAG: hypothetical protein GEV03_10695 [Streptosporangiales bacterium]|nr:hypothetical protein [Streptosporangiales bacterium]
MRYGVIVPLTASGVRGDLGDAVERLADRLVEFGQRDRRLLDFGIGANATNETVDVELTLEAGGPGDAITSSLSCLRAASQAHGSVAAYEVIDEEGLTVRPLERLFV